MMLPKSKLYDAIVKSMSGRISTYIVQFIALAIYARMFTPQEFGIIASIQVFVTFFKMLSNVGIGPAIINENKFNERKRDGIFTVTLLLGFFIATLFYFFSFFLNLFYGDNYTYQEIAVFVSISIFFSTINILPMTALVKDAEFTKIAFIDIIAEIFSFIAIYYLYSQGFGLISLAIRPALQSVVRYLLSWHLSKNTVLGKAKIGRELYHIKSIFSFSMYQFLFNFINYFSRNLDNILIAKYFGMSSVGAYDKAYQLMRYPLLMTTSALTPAIQPILTNFRENNDLIVREHNKLAVRLTGISIPISVYIFIFAKDIISILFGVQWLGIESLIKIFCFMIPIQAVMTTSGSFFQVMNKPKLLFYTGLLAAVSSISSILVGLYLGGLNDIAFMLVIAFIINFIQIYYFLFKCCFKSSLMDFYIGILKVIVILIFPVIIFYTINVHLVLKLNFGPFCNVLIGMIVGLVSLVLFYKPLRKSMTH